MPWLAARCRDFLNICICKQNLSRKQFEILNTTFWTKLKKLSWFVLKSCGAGERIGRPNVPSIFTDPDPFGQNSTDMDPDQGSNWRGEGWPTKGDGVDFGCSMFGTKHSFRKSILIINERCFQVIFSWYWPIPSRKVLSRFNNHFDTWLFWAHS